jgi:hypothetical protein
MIIVLLDRRLPRGRSSRTNIVLLVHRLPRGRSSQRMGNCKECPDRIKLSKVGKKGRICADCVSRTGRPNPLAQMKKQRCNRKPQRNGKGRTEEQNRERRRARCLALRPSPIAFPLPTTVKENATYIAGKAAFDAEFRGITEAYPERKVPISVVVHSKATLVIFKQECCD